MAGDTGMAGKVALLLWAQTLGFAGTQTTWIVVEPSWMPAVLWDWVTLTCQGSGTVSATTWYKDGQRWGQQGCDRLTVTENGTYTCDRPGSGLSLPMRVLDDWLVLQVPARPLLEGDTVALRCRDRRNNLVTWVSFYHEEKQLVELRNGTELTLFPLKLHHSGHYRCKGWLKDRQWVVSAPVIVTVHGTYQCVATNQLGQDKHRVFRALSPELALMVTTWGHRDTVAAGVGGALLFLLLLVGVIVAWHWWHRVAAKKQQERAPPDPHPPQRRGRFHTPTL
ncbi:low affinity immunoglobulin gamma Fc region receptor III-like isoform X3 [Zonotrichia albicollis]|uniref:low affinity immunoglobulin gamma Fc region receptor III-like isoform X3 n=1 Tax=Zonotrichia albicollis TaxID=44394 RepID=UPI003D810163